MVVGVSKQCAYSLDEESRNLSPLLQSDVSGNVSFFTFVGVKFIS